jgi:hypothetical protein
MKLESRILTHSSTGEINGLDVKIILTYEMLCEIAPFQLSSIETFHVWKESHILTHSSTCGINGLNVKTILTCENLCGIGPFHMWK